MTAPFHEPRCVLTFLGDEVAPWQARTFPDHQSTTIKALKVAEEAGEVCGAIVKMGDGRRTLEDVCDEIGDLVISLAGLAALLDVDLPAVVMERWAVVRQRDYAEAHARSTSAS